MKNKFSNIWIGSRQIRKQRKYRMNAPLHVKHKMMASALSEELSKKHNRRAFPIRKGDNVKIMEGKYKGKTGKISDVDIKKMKVSIEGVQASKKDGTKVNLKFQPSNLQIQELNLEDKRRNEALNRSKKEPKEIKIKEKKNAS